MALFRDPGMVSASAAFMVWTHTGSHRIYSLMLLSFLAWAGADSRSRCSALILHPPLFPSRREWHKLDPSSFPREESYADSEQHVKHPQQNLSSSCGKNGEIWLGAKSETWVNALNHSSYKWPVWKETDIMLINGTVSASSASGSK